MGFNLSRMSSRVIPTSVQAKILKSLYPKINKMPRYQQDELVQTVLRRINKSYDVKSSSKYKTADEEIAAIWKMYELNKCPIFEEYRTNLLNTCRNLRKEHGLPI